MYNIWFWNYLFLFAKTLFLLLRLNEKMTYRDEKDKY